jgi:hypothetical protein
MIPADDLEPVTERCPSLMAVLAAEMTQHKVVHRVLVDTPPSLAGEHEMVLNRAQVEERPGETVLDFYLRTRA